MFSTTDLFFILLAGLFLLVAISLTVAFYSAASSHSKETKEDENPDEMITSSLPDAHMTKWHLGDHMADHFPPRSVTNNMEKSPFAQPYQKMGDTTLDEAQEHPTRTTPENKTVERANRQIREMVHLHHRPEKEEPSDNENILNH